MTSRGGASLAVGISRIHRSTSLEALMQTFLSVAPKLVDADAFGLYLLDGQLRARTIYAVRADRCFLTEYERLRMSDPCFLHLLRHRSFIHTHELLSGRAWTVHPLHQLMSRWGLHYSIEAPLVTVDRLVGTVNIARRDRGYFDDASLSRARFLCEEIACAFERIAHVARLEQTLAYTGPRTAGRDRPPDTTPPSETVATDPAAGREPEPAYIRAAVDHMRAHCAEPISVERVAAASGVSQRKLTRGFRRHRGTSPKAMLRGLRFQCVRDALLAAEPGTTTVADIATAWGFYELGRFAVEYRRRYAEKPSATLRRMATARKPAAMPEIFMLPEETTPGPGRWCGATEPSH